MNRGLKAMGADRDGGRAEGAASCPFCGSDAVFALRWAMPNRDAIHRLQCGRCDGWGPRASSAEEARRLWDGRGGEYRGPRDDQPARIE